MERPLVSFCFTTYKRDKFLKETLDSVKKQSYDHFEVIISDNDPEEMGRAVVASMNDSRFKYFPNGENLGMKKSFNKSLERSQGEFIVMIADDDPVYDDMLQTLVELSNEFPGYGMYLGGADWYCANPQVAQLYNLKVGTNSLLNNHQEVGHKTCYSSDEYLSGFYSFTIFPAYLWSTGMVRRKALLDMGGVPDYGTPFLGDYAYLALMGSHSGAVTINKAFGRQTVHSQNFGRNQNEQLVNAAIGYTSYLTKRLEHLASWNIAKEKMYRFVGHWVLSHLAFLFQYNKKNGIEDVSLAEAEKAVFEIEFMKKYKLKYYLKKNYPLVHNSLVRIKSTMQ